MISRTTSVEINIKSVIQIEIKTVRQQLHTWCFMILHGNSFQSWVVLVKIKLKYICAWPVHSAEYCTKHHRLTSSSKTHQETTQQAKPDDSWQRFSLHPKSVFTNIRLKEFMKDTQHEHADRRFRWNWKQCADKLILHNWHCHWPALDWFCNRNWQTWNKKLRAITWARCAP